jgi:hypothetical protein
MNVTKPYFVHLITQQGEPYLWGFPQPEAVLKVNDVNSAGYGNIKGHQENKTMYGQLKPQTFPLVAANIENKFRGMMDSYIATPTYGPHIKG